MTDVRATGGFRSFASVATDRPFHRRLLYLLLSVPLGFLYYVLFGFGFIVGITLSVFLVGLPVLLATLYAARVLGALERSLANRLLDTSIAAADSLPSLTEDGVRVTVTDLAISDTTWRAIAFLVLKTFVGFVTWLFILVAGITALSLVTAPLTDSVVLLEAWTIDSLPERLLAVPLGVVVGLVALHVLDTIADKTGGIATALLGGETGV